MSVACAGKLTWAELVDHWAGDLDGARQDAIDAHLMGCDECSALSARVASITEATRAMLPLLLSSAQLTRLRASHVRLLEHTMLPGERKQVRFPADVDVLVHRLAGLELADVARVGFSLHVESSGQVLAQLDDAPFDRGSGSVLIACQQHFVAFPPDTVAEVRVEAASGEHRVHRYTILHDFEAAKQTSG